MREKRRFRLIWRVAALVLFVSIWIAWTQSQQAPASLALQKIKDDLYVIALSKGVGGGNIAVYLTDEGVILVDDMFDRDYAAVMEQVKSLTIKPVKYVLNTHQHEDHAGGNAKMLGASAEVIAHRNVRSNMVRLNQPGLPRVTFSDEMDVNLGGKEVVARHYGRGHTGGDAVIYFPARKVIHTGDLFLTNPPQPFIDYANGGSALEWTSTLDEVLKLDFDVAIPGHGPVSDRAGLMKFRSNFETMRNRISGMVRGGRTKDEVAKTLVTEFGWAQGGLAVQQVDRMIAELR
jgi:glyoxylase-like metal-dependent hydrolase (beta-lactamase superfamily II)